MRKILSALALLLFSATLLFAQGVQEPQSDETLVKVTGVTVDDQGNYMIETIRQDGEKVIYIASDATTESDRPLSEIADGDYILVKDTGVMTMSIPPQLPISAVRDVTDAVEIGLIPYTQSAPRELPAVEIAIGEVNADNLDAAFSYSYGYLSMQGLIAQNLYPRGGYFARGVLDAADIGTVTPLLTPDEMDSALNEFMTDVYNAGLPTDYGDVIADEETIRGLGRPESLEDRFGYSYGYFTIVNLLYGGVQVEAPEFAAGLLTALYGADPVFTEDEMNGFIEAYIQKLADDYRAWLEELAAENLSEAEAFLSDNAERPEVTVLPSGVQIEYTYDDTTEGASPTDTDTVTVDYTLTLMDGTVMDQGTDVSFSLSSLIPGFTEAVKAMTVGDSIRAYIPPELGYGAAGTQTIEPNSLLIFDITLDSIAAPEAAAPAEPAEAAETV